MFNWFATLDARERKTLGAAFGGWAMDAFDFMVYTFVIPTLITAWAMSKGDAGMIGTVTLILSAFGGWIAGILADRYGRVKVLQITILWFAFFTFLCGFADSYWELLIARALQGLGFGGEWAVGSVLIGEMVRAQHRGKAVGTVQSGWAIGWGVAAIAYTLVYTSFDEGTAWRVLFWLGLLPALFVFYIRRHVPEPPVFEATRAKALAQGGSNFMEIFSPQLRRTTLLACLMITGMMIGYFAVTFWLPTYLKTVQKLSVPTTGLYTTVVITGSFLGYLTAAYLSDRIGRKKTFVLFAACSAVFVVFYTLIPISQALMLVLGFPLGFFVSGNFSGVGAFLTELLPSRVRGSGQGFIYNFGRGMSAFTPLLVGMLSDTIGLGRAIGIVAACAFALVIVMVGMLPETRGRELAVYV